MTTESFISLLESFPDKNLIFEYREGERVGAHYHITEIKNIGVEAVDCGGQVDAWRETVVQLWESAQEAHKTSYLTAGKALAIFQKVHSLKPMTQQAPIKFEYGNNSFHTAQLAVRKVKQSGSDLLVQLRPVRTDCKAKETCGVPSHASVEMPSNCSPGSGCC